MKKANLAIKNNTDHGCCYFPIFGRPSKVSHVSQHLSFFIYHRSNTSLQRRLSNLTHKRKFLDFYSLLKRLKSFTNLNLKLHYKYFEIYLKYNNS